MRVHSSSSLRFVRVQTDRAAPTPRPPTRVRTERGRRLSTHTIQYSATSYTIPSQNTTTMGLQQQPVSHHAPLWKHRVKRQSDSSSSSSGESRGCCPLGNGSSPFRAWGSDLVLFPPRSCDDLYAPTYSLTHDLKHNQLAPHCTRSQQPATPSRRTRNTTSPGTATASGQGCRVSVGQTTNDLMAALRRRVRSEERQADALVIPTLHPPASQT